MSEYIEAAHIAGNFVSERLGDSNEWAALLSGPFGKNGTARAWFESRNLGTPCDTLQITVRDGRVVKAWAPGIRRIDALTPGKVELNGSTREYAGITVLHSTDTALVAAHKWGDDIVVLAYRA